MLPWNVKFDDSQYETLAASVHRALNRRRPDSFEDAAALLRREVGTKFTVKAKRGFVEIRPIPASPAMDPPRAILVRRNEKKTCRAPRRAASPWTKVVKRCAECKKTHVLYFAGPIAPIIYGYVCPKTSNVTIMRTDVEGWNHDHWGDVRVFAVALPKPDRLGVDVEAALAGRESE